MEDKGPVRQPHYRRNFIALVGDYVGFGLGLAFASTTTVIPDFIGRLTTSKVVVGLFLTVADGAWLLPQLVFANLLMDKRRKKPYVTGGAIVGRPFFLVYALLLWLGLARSPGLALVALFVVVFLLLGSDSLSAVAWFDIMAKAIPEERRGRLIGISQALQGVLTIGVGLLLALLLSDKGPGFPANYAIIFALTGFFLLLSLACWLFVIEPDEPVAEQRPAWRDYIPHLLRTLRHDKVLVRVIVVRMLAGFDMLALNFYILFALEQLGLPDEVVGIFTAVQTVGSIVASVGLGVLSERAGNHRVIQIATAVSATAPLLGLVLALRGVGGGTAIAVVYGWVFLSLGVVASSFMLGYVNYVLALAPAGERPTYVGLFNTIGGVLVVLPTIGGWLLQSTSYPVLFGVTAGILVIAHALSWRIPAPRRQELASPGGL